MSNASTPAPPNPTAALISALQTLISSAQADAALTGATPDTITASQQLVFHAQAVIATLQVVGSGPPAYTVTVQDGPLGTETVFAIAERELGDLTRFTDLLALNGLSFIALSPGQHVTIPAS